MGKARTYQLLLEIVQGCGHLFHMPKIFSSSRHFAPVRFPDPLVSDHPDQAGKCQLYLATGNILWQLEFFTGNLQSIWMENRVTWPLVVGKKYFHILK